nr:acyl-CoA dehydrogenase family protein [Mesorhizobium sp.]
MSIFSAEMSVFREEVIAFCRKEMPPEIRRKVRAGPPLGKLEYQQWQAMLHGKGWAGGVWPTSAGGGGWSLTRQFVFEQALGEAGAPWLIPMGLTYVAPVIYTFGSDEQKQRHLPGIQSSSVWWCQGYSEPGAGSDLASVKTSAERDGDHYVVRGQKIWTTMAHWADWMFCLVRTATNGKQQNGVSFLLIDMNSPGISVRPIVSIDNDHHLNEVFFDHVRVPAANLIGEEGKGWTYAKFLLKHERLTIAEPGKAKFLLAEVERLARNVGEGQNPFLIRQITEARLRIDALDALCDRMLRRAESGEDIGNVVSILKIRSTELIQHIEGIGMEVAARIGLPMDFEIPARAALGEVPGEASQLAYLYLRDRAHTIAGGATEVQRNIIARSYFGF